MGIPEFDVNRMSKMKIDYQRYFMKTTFRHFATNMDGKPDSSMVKVVDAVFKDIFGEKKVFTKLMKSGFAIDTFDPYSNISFEALLGLFDTGNNVEIIKQLVQINAQVRHNNKKIEKYKNDRRKVTQLKKKMKENEELTRIYKKCIKKMRKRYEITTGNRNDFDFVRDFMKSKDDDMWDYGWFDDSDMYKWGDGPNRNGRLNNMMKKMNKSDQLFYQSMNDMDMGRQIPRAYDYGDYPMNPNGLNVMNFKMNGYIEDDDDEDDDDIMLGGLDFDRYSPQVGGADVPFDRETLSEIYAMNPELGQRSMDRLAGKKSDMESLDDLLDEDDDEGIIIEPANESGNSGYSDELLEMLNGIMDKLDDFEDKFDDTPTTEGIAEAIKQSQNTTMKYVNMQITGLMNKLNLKETDDEVVEPEHTPVKEEVVTEEVKATEEEMSAAQEEIPSRVMINENERIVIDQGSAVVSEPIVLNAIKQNNTPKQVKTKGNGKQNTKVLK